MTMLRAAAVAQGKGSSVTSVLVAHRFRGGDSRRRIVVPAVAARMSAARERRTVAGDAFGQEQYAAVPPGRKRGVYLGHRRVLQLSGSSAISRRSASLRSFCDIRPA